VAASSTDIGLAKVIVATPKRRLEVALPEHLPVAALLPTLLRHSEDDLAADRPHTGGWLLRRMDGVPLDGGRTLAAQAVRDGEVLHLLPRHADWPELDYDDLVEVIAAGARRGGAPWTRAATRTWGLAVTALTLSLPPVVVLMAGGAWLGPAIVLLVLSVLLVTAGIVLSRALADSVAGAVIGVLALPNGLIGGLLLLGGELPLRQLGAPHLLMGSAIILTLGVIGYAGVADLHRLFVAGIVTGLGGAAGAGLVLTGINRVGAAAIVITVFLLIGPAHPLLSVWLAKVPMPVIPRSAEDLRTNDVLPPPQQTMARVIRSTELLAGVLLGTAAITAVSAVMLAAAGTVSALLLAGTVAAAHLLRARMVVAIRQRAAVLVGGIVAMVATVIGATAAAPGWARFGVVLPTLLLAAALVGVAALTLSRRAPSPKLGRWADIVDVLLTLAAGPIAAQTLGLYHLMRGLAG
jgi:type VII secretion integral membrane protein EccD